MTMFGSQAGFNIKFDKQGNILVVIRITAMGGFITIDEPWVAFSNLSDARTFGQMIVDFCDTHEIRVPKVFEDSFKENHNNGN